MNKKIRNLWMVSLLIFHIGLYIIGALDQLFGQLFDGFPRGNFFGGDTSLRILIWLFFVPLYHTIIGATSYYFAYMKGGIIWLSILMPCILLLALVSLNRFISYGTHEWSFMIGCPKGIMCHQISIFYLSIYYLFNCYQLYKFNGGKGILHLMSYIKSICREKVLK